MIKFRFHQILL